MSQFPTHCARCGDPLQSSTMSKFNTDIICLPCKEDEQLAPGYADADRAESEACQRGDYNFRGVGLSEADREFLRARLAQRKQVR